MRQSNTHIIKNTSVDFQYSGKTDAMLLQQEVAGWCRSVLTSSVDTVLSEYDQEEVIVIDNISLEINLGETDNWKKVLAERIIHQLKEKIHSKISSGGGEVTVKSKTAGFSETLLYYLKHGILPWHSIVKTVHDFETETTHWLKTISPEEIKYFLQNIPDHKSILRFVTLLKQDDFETVVTSVSGESRQTVSSFFEVVQAITKSISGEKVQQQLLLNNFRETLLSGFVETQELGLSNRTISAWIYAIENNYSLDVQKIDIVKINNVEVRNILLQIGKDKRSKTETNQSNKTESKQTDESEQKHNITITHKTENIPDEKDELTVNKRIEPQNSNAQTRNDESGAKINPEVIIKAIKTNTEPDIEPNKELIEELGEGAFISNAGAIIIAPFLTTLFSRTGLMKEGNITDASTALCLVHYCITGSLNPAEFELLLPKILCGVAPETVFEITSAADEKMITEANEMLKSVIEYWEVLKDTSVDGLREAFLQRNGKLTFSENEWELTVEQKPYDMLLEQLPWNISLIKLPWMKNCIRTYWV